VPERRGAEVPSGSQHLPLTRPIRTAELCWFSQCRLLRPTASVAITASSTGNRFTLYAQQRNASAAEQACQAAGGHLATFSSREEQLDVEQGLADTGYLLPSFHKQYWIGLTTTDDAWPMFRCSPAGGRRALLQTPSSCRCRCGSRAAHSIACSRCDPAWQAGAAHARGCCRCPAAQVGGQDADGPGLQ
jgi:hypothetical protein